MTFAQATLDYCAVAELLKQPNVSRVKSNPWLEKALVSLGKEKQVLFDLSGHGTRKLSRCSTNWAGTEQVFQAGFLV